MLSKLSKNHVSSMIFNQLNLLNEEISWEILHFQFRFMQIFEMYLKTYQSGRAELMEKTFGRVKRLILGPFECSIINFLWAHIKS